LTVGGTVAVPGDKSISHRALILSALADGTSRVRGLADSADVRSTASVLAALGAELPAPSPDVRIAGRGLRALRAAAAPLDCGNSGTTTRLMAGVAAAYPFVARFIGDESLSRRPMRRVARPLRAMGAEVELSPADTLPMVVHGGDLAPIEWEPEVPSAQIKSAVLLAALAAGVPVTVREPLGTRDHTERMLRARGIEVVGEAGAVRLVPGPLAPTDMTVAGDPSSAAFFLALAALADRGSVTLPSVCVNDTRTGFLRALERMGATVRVKECREEGGEPVATLTGGPAELWGIEVRPADVPAMVDELPLLACVAARASGETVITGAGELRVKESDRIAAVVANLRTLGADAEELPDGMRVRGGARTLRGEVRTYGDHRIAMAFGVLGALPGNEIRVDHPECVAVSYPAFWEHLAAVARA
jgi:3-phosphoshikimate 1-carboxyvinyltransferase